MNFQEKKEQYLSRVHDFYPKFDFTSSFSMFSGELDAPTSAKVSANNNSFNHSDIGKAPIELAHYTSVDALFNILNSKTVRMYNCLNMNDSKELVHAASQFDVPLSHNEMNDFRRQNFIFSSSRVDNKNQEDFLMWRLYGNNGKGVCIHFEIEPQFINWTGLIANQVIYFDKVKTSRLSEFLEFHKSFQKQYKIFNSTPDFIPMLLLLNKENKWRHENEFRIVANCPFNKFSGKIPPLIGNTYSPWLSKTLKHAVNTKNESVSYLEMPTEDDGHFVKMIKDNKLEAFDLTEKFPRIKLKRVVLGYEISKEAHEEIYKSLSFHHSSIEVQKSIFR